MKHFSRIFCLILALFLLAGCGEEVPETTAPTAVPPESTTAPLPTAPALTDPTETTAPAHTHKPTEWEFDQYDHWYLCDCGKTVYQVHDLDATGLCTICGVTVEWNTHGICTVRNYDPFGTLIREITWYSDGTLLCDDVTRVEYFPDGNLSHLWSYSNGVLQWEQLYVQCDDQRQVRVSQHITYEPDGSKVVALWNEQEDAYLNTYYDHQGNVTVVEEREYVYTPETVTVDCYWNGELYQHRIYVIAPDGERHEARIEYYENGELSYTSANEYEFAPDGTITYSCFYWNEVRKWAHWYEPDGQGGYYLSHKTEYDENGEIKLDAWYDAQGNELQSGS